MKMIRLLMNERLKWHVFRIVLLTIVFTACDRRDLNELYYMAEKNELLVKQMEADAIDINDQIANLQRLTEALMKRLYISGRKKTSNGYVFTFSDSLKVEIKQGRTPVIEIDPVTNTWHIDGEDTGVKAKGEDGKVQMNPRVRINPGTFLWEFSVDGMNWITTDIRAKGESGKSGNSPVVGINAAGNWVINGEETVPPVKAVADDGENAPAPMIGIDKDIVPPVWTISLDGGVTWTPTTVAAGAENGNDGRPGENAEPYIQQVAVIGDSIIFTFSDLIPGTVPPTNRQGVKMQKKEFKIAIVSGDWYDKAVDGTLWLVFGVKNTRKLTYEIMGDDMVSVDALDVPVGFKVTLDKNKKEVTVISSDVTAHQMILSGSFRLVALNTEGRTAEVQVQLSNAYEVDGCDFAESYVYNVLAPSGDEIAMLYLSMGYSTRGVKKYLCMNRELSFQPLPDCYPSTLSPYLAKDVDGNEYAVMLLPWLGRTFWMVENLRTEHYNDGTAISNLTDAGAWATDKKGAFCYYNNDKVTYEESQGALYNGYAVESGKLAPYGWRVPTEEDWEELEACVTSEDMDVDDWRGMGAGDKLKSIEGWKDTDTGESGNGIDRLHFSARPTGYRDETGIIFKGEETQGYWWCSTAATRTNFSGLLYRLLQNDRTDVYRSVGNKNRGFAVRCIKVN